MNLGKNYTSNDPDHVDSPKDWLGSCLAFVGALSHLLKEKEGVVVAVKNDLKQFFPLIQNIIVYQESGEIKVVEADDNLIPGQLVWMHDIDEN